MLKIKLSEALKIRFSYKNHMILKTTILALLKMVYECLFGMAVKFLAQVPLQCPHSFWNLLVSVPTSTQPSPWSEAAAMPTTLCGDKGAWPLPRKVPLGFPQDPGELHWEYWRVIPLCDPFADPVSTTKTFFTLMLYTPHIWGLPRFFSRFLCNFLSGVQQGKFYGRTLHNFLVPWTYSDK